MTTTWIPSGEAWGTPTQVAVVGGTGIPSAEVFGTATITHSSVTLVQPTGIPSAEAFGIPTQTFICDPGIPSAEAFGTPTLLLYYSVILCSGTATGFGELLIGQLVGGGTAIGIGTLQLSPQPHFAQGAVNADSTLSAVAVVQHKAGAALLGSAALTVGNVSDAAIVADASMLAEATVQLAVSASIGASSWSIAQSLPFSVPNLYRIASPAIIRGYGFLAYVGPQQILGTVTIRAYVEVLKVPRAYCPPRRVKVFRWGYILTRGDLELVVCDSSGNPFAPVVVLFAFYQIVHGGQRMLVGPPNRRPAVDGSEGKPGRYYATGTAGELGQPGEWVVVWRYQRSWWTPTVTFEEHFKVLDEVNSCDPWRMQGRHCKYGWT